MDERLKKLRKKLDLTQREFAEKLHIKQNTVATYEMGRIIPSDSVVAGICREFNVVNLSGREPSDTIYCAFA